MNALDNLLTEISRDDLRGEFVVPMGEREKALGEIIAAGCGAVTANLSEEDTTGKTGTHLVHRITARKEDFAQSARAAVETLVTELRGARANRIDVAFYNTVGKGNEWGDLVLLAVRFTAH